MVAGLFFAVDLICWHQAIADVGAGLATVLGNLQVVVVPFAAWAVLAERPGRRILAALPLTLIGVLLISGALEDGAYGAHPLRGVVFGALTGLSYAGFILVLRHGNEDLRRPAGPLFDATWVSAVAALAVALVLGVDDLAPAWPSAAWLDHARAVVAGARLDADQRLAAAPARGADVDDPHDPAGRLGRARDRAAPGGPDRAPARGRGLHPRRARLDRRPAALTRRAGRATRHRQRAAVRDPRVGRPR